MWMIIGNYLRRLTSSLKYTAVWNLVYYLQLFCREWTSVHIFQSKNSIVHSCSILKLQSNFFHLQLSHFQLHIFYYTVKSTVRCLFPVECDLITHMCFSWTELLRIFLLRLSPTLVSIVAVLRVLQTTSFGEI